MPSIWTAVRYALRVLMLTDDGIERRINSLFRSIKRADRNPWRLAVALGLLESGWFCQMIALWVALHAIDVLTVFSIMLFAVPARMIADVTPLLSGAGGIEWTLAVLVAAVSSIVSFDVMIAGIVVSRGFVYWVPVVLDGPVMSAENTCG